MQHDSHFVSRYANVQTAVSSRIHSITHHILMHSKSVEVCSLLCDSCFKTKKKKNWWIHLEVGNCLLMSSKIVLNGENGLEFCKPYATLCFQWTDTIILDSVRHTIILPLWELNKQQERNENLVGCSTFHNKPHDDIYKNKLLDTKLK
jgi:hypothetical protein